MNSLPEFISVKRDSNNTNILTNKITDKYIKVGNIELEYLYNIYNNSDNTTQKLSANQQKFLYDNFKKMGFLSEETSRELAKKSKKSDLSRIYLYKANPSNFFEKNKWLYKGNHIKIFLLISIIIFVAGALLLFFNFTKWFRVENFTLISTYEIIIFYLLVLLTLFIHEFSHANSSYYYGGKVKEVGIMLMYLGPAFYCDVTPIYLLEKKSKKIFVLLSGILSQLLMTSIAVIVLYFFELANFNIEIILYYIVFNILNILINLSPIIKLDGYWILVQLTNITNLREKSIKFLMSFFHNNLYYYRKRYNVRQRITLNIYGITGLVGTSLIWIYSFYLLFQIFNKYLSGVWVVIILTLWGAILTMHLSKKTYKYIKSLKSEVKYHQLEG